MNGCSFTGHRQIKNEHLDYVKEKLERGIVYAYNEGVRQFFTGGAIGFDTLAALAVLKIRKSYNDITLTLILPCKNQSESWSDAQKKEYEKIKRECDEIIYVSDDYYDGCMRERNARLVEKADMIIAYMYKERSGAAQTVGMAKRLGRRVYNICPKSITL